jgi:hypothetical protein
MRPYGSVKSGTIFFLSRLFCFQLVLFSFFLIAEYFHLGRTTGKSKEPAIFEN